MEGALSPCATCTARCCEAFPTTISLVDFLRFTAEEQAHVLFAPGFTRVSGVMERQPGGRCIFSRGVMGCLIHERKPDGCREMDPWTCTLYEEAADP